ncbi:MAG: chemotaxis protein CheX [Planctomycetes bacterium]|nr:chemotaxis protein CheX [Planctomycetota bacterium]
MPPTMKVDYINAFVGATRNVFSSMLQTEVTLGQVSVKTSHVTAYDISGIIGLSGDAIGCVVVSFPMDTALAAYKAFAGEEVDPMDPNFLDAIGEVTNMIAGNAKAELEGMSISIGLPTTIMGRQHCVNAPQNVPFIVVPCHCGLGNFAIEVAFRCVKE